MKTLKVVYTYGVFDLLHPGHVHLLERAKQLGDLLVVGVVADEPVAERKGKNRPIMNLADRMCLIESLKCVDVVLSQESYDPSANLHKLSHVDVLAKGDDWEYIPGTEVIKARGGILVKLPYSKEWSTTKLVEKIKNDI